MGDRKQVQDTRFDRHLTGAKKKKVFPAHDNNSTDLR